MGWVIVFGFIVGLPCEVIAGSGFLKFISKKIFVEAPQEEGKSLEAVKNQSPVWIILSLIFLPIFLIVGNTILSSPMAASWQLPEAVTYTTTLLGHPFTALILANIIAWYVLGVRRGCSKQDLLDISTKALYPAGIIILLTGAGGAFKQILTDTGAGTMMANSLSSAYIPPVYLVL